MELNEICHGNTVNHPIMQWNDMKQTTAPKPMILHLFYWIFVVENIEKCCENMPSNGLKTLLCRKSNCSKGDIFHNTFANRMRVPSFQKNHHNKLHR